MSQNKLRPYQSKAVTEIKNEFKKGRRKVLLKMSTGSGKTTIFSHILKQVKDNGRHAIIVVRGRDLVQNASDRLTREGVEHGVMMAGHFMKKPNALIQVCSVDTLFARKIVPKASLCVIDEVHMSTSKAYRWLVESYPKAYFLGVTATPYVRDGLTHIADTVVSPIGINELINQGFLVPPKYFTPSQLSLDGLKIENRSGDYAVKELEERLSESTTYGDIVANYKLKCPQAKAIVFCVSVAHSKKVRDLFNAEGINAVHVDAKSNRKERDEAMKKIETGEIHVITNVNLFSVGVDIPCLEAVILARPTKSYNFYIQAVGRGARPYKNKKFFYLFDHVGNIQEHGFIESEPEVLLEGWKGENSKIKESILNCEACYIIFDPKVNYQNALRNFNDDETALKRFLNNKKEKLGDRCNRSKSLFICPSCDHDNTDYAERKREQEEKEDKLKEISEEDRILITQKNRLKELKKIRKAKGYRQGWVYHAFKSEYGEEVAAKFIKKRVVPSWVQKQLEGK